MPRLNPPTQCVVLDVHPFFLRLSIPQRLTDEMQAAEKKKLEAGMLGPQSELMQSLNRSETRWKSSRRRMNGKLTANNNRKQSSYFSGFIGDAGFSSARSSKRAASSRNSACSRAESCTYCFG